MYYQHSVLIILGASLFGCQLNRPVPVERVSMATSSSSPVVKSSPESSQPQTQDRQAPAPKPQAEAPWKPIEIKPIERSQKTVEPKKSANELRAAEQAALNATASRSSRTTPTQDSTPQPANQSPRIHRVKQGENLYAIARLYKLDLKQLASANQLAPPYNIYPGQTVKLLSESDATVANQSPTTALRSKPTAAKTAATPSKWSWPAMGEVSEPASNAAKSITIFGTNGQSVRATADGIVSYAGNGVTGFGELVVVRHGGQYHSVYGYNRRLLVKQGDKVKRGQRIAEMGATSADKYGLFFQIGRNQKPLNPLELLPNESVTAAR